MDTSSRIYIAIDLKSFYASVECVDRHLDPLATNLVVADCSRTEKTICLAVSPSLKAHGIPGRPRLFEVIQKVRDVNRLRLSQLSDHRFRGKSSNAPVLSANPSLEVDYITAMPRMQRYMQVSTTIYGIYLKYISPEDIHVYSIDEVFIDATDYLHLYKKTAKDLAMTLIKEVLQTTGITATAGIGSNLYLSKIAMDIVAKHLPADENGVRIAELDEVTYRRQLWNHRPLTDFWRLGGGSARRLESIGLHTMGEIARMSTVNEELLYRIFGINAELLIDHAWGWEPCSLRAIKAYRPSNNSLSSGQVLQTPYDYDKTRLVVREMADLLTYSLVEKHLVSDQVALTLYYDTENLSDPQRRNHYHGAVVRDHYGRLAPKEAHGSQMLTGGFTSSSKKILQAATDLFDQIAAPSLLVRKIYIVLNHVVNETILRQPRRPVQLELFTDYHTLEQKEAEERQEQEREKRQQQAVLAIRQKLGKNAIFKGMNLEEGATAKERNNQIGGHRA